MPTVIICTPVTSIKGQICCLLDYNIGWKWIGSVLSFWGMKLFFKLKKKKKEEKVI